MFDNLNVSSVSQHQPLKASDVSSKQYSEIEIVFDSNNPIIKERPLGYQNVDMQKVEAIAQEFYDAMEGPGTDKIAMKKACEKLSKYNVLEVLEAFAKLDYNKDKTTLMEFIRDDFSTYGAGTDMFQDDSKEFLDKIYQLLQQRASDMRKICEDCWLSDRFSDSVEEYFRNLLNNANRNSTNLEYSIAQDAASGKGFSINDNSHWMFSAFNPTQLITQEANFLKSLENTLFKGAKYDAESSFPEF